MNWKEKFTTIVSRAGKKTVAVEESPTIYRLYDSAQRCPLWAYISLVCDNNLQALVVEGVCPEETLKTLRSAIIAEFNELSGSENASELNEAVRQVYLYANQMRGLNISLYLVSLGIYDNILEFLLDLGIRYKVPQTDQQRKRLIQMIEGKLREVSMRFKEESARLDALMKDQPDHTFTRKDFNEQIALVSRYMGFRIDPKQTTLEEYAAYLKTYNSSVTYGSKQHEQH